MINFATIPAFNRRRPETLVRMWRQLNVSEWPEELGPAQPLEHHDCWDLMLRLQQELGRRVIFGRSIPSLRQKEQVRHGN